MAKYHYRGPSLNLFEAQTGGLLKGRFLYHQAGQFGLTNSDGSTSYYLGVGLAWNQSLGRFTSGTITAINHYSSSGVYIDGLSGLNLAITRLEPLLTAPAGTAALTSLQTTLMAGDDRLTGEAGTDRLVGGAGNDILTGGSGADQLWGGIGNDTASYRSSADAVYIDLAKATAAGGDAAGDKLYDIENVDGSSQGDVISGTASGNTLNGLGGDDSLFGGDGNDRIDGGDGKDFLIGEAGGDLIFGGSGDDVIDAGTGRDLVKGSAGNDVIYGGPDPDVIIYDFAWEQLHARYNGNDYTIWIEAPDGIDHVFSALSFATTTGTYHFDVPTQSWVMVSAMTGNDWIAAW